MEEREVRVGVVGAGLTGAVQMHACTPHHLHPPALATGFGEGGTRPVGTEDSAVMQFKTEGRAMGTTVISQISAGRKNRLWLGVDAVDLPAREPMEEVAP
jgi:hypothetical protein